VTKICRQLTDVDALRATDLTVEPDGLTFAVRPRWHKPRCGGCGRRGGRYDRAPERHWRHLAVGATVVRLRYVPRRVDCPACGGVVTEQVAWARHGSRFTRELEEFDAYLARLMDKDHDHQADRDQLAHRGAIIERIVSERLPDDRLSGLRVIGVDEFSYCKRHRYLTVVVDHDRACGVWAARGRGADSLNALFEHIGWIKRSRYALLKNPWDLTPRQNQKLADIQANNERLYRAYLLKESLARALDYLQLKRTRQALEAWLDWACHSKFPTFVTLLRTVRKHNTRKESWLRSRNAASTPSSKASPTDSA
jgi:transposase